MGNELTINVVPQFKEKNENQINKNIIQLNTEKEKEQEPKKIEEIVYVIKSSKNEIIINNEEKLLEKLEKLPKVTSLIRENFNINTKKPSSWSFLNNNSNKIKKIQKFENVDYLDKLKSKSFIDVLAQFQTNSIIDNKKIYDKETILIKSFSSCKIKCLKFQKNINDNNEKIKKISNSLNEVDNIKKQINLLQNDINKIFFQFNLLNEIIPSFVKIKCSGSPFFKKKKKK
jgi:hypothetical protein